MTRLLLFCAVLLAVCGLSLCTQGNDVSAERPRVCRDQPFEDLYKSSEEAVDLLRKCHEISKSVSSATQRSQCLKSCKRFMWSLHFPQCENGEPLLPCAGNCDEFFETCEIKDRQSFSLSQHSQPLSICAKPGEKCEEGPNVERKPLGSEFFRRNPAIFNYGFNAPGNATTLCDYYGCENVVNYQRFFCFNWILGIGVPCQSSTWDNYADMCSVINQYDPGCTSKDCVNKFRMHFNSPPAMCQKVSDPPGNNEKWIPCGRFQSSDPTNRVVAFGFTSIFAVSIPQPNTGPKCKLAYRYWSKNAPIGNDDLVFSL